MEHIRINDKTRLEQIKMSMAPVIFAGIDNNREYLEKWLPFVELTRQVTDIEDFISGINLEDANHDEYFSIWHKEEFAGIVGLKDTDWVNRKTEIGYWVTKNMQGKGIITACVDKLIRYAFKVQNFNRIQIKVAEKNHKSASIPIKLNFKFEGTERQGELHKNKFLDLRIYSLLKSDWLK
jgi:ribosomal-protein-serine acetyltransferase